MGGSALDESTFIKEVASGFDDFSPHTQNRSLTGASYPEMAVLHQN
jgi:hypothetical protein